MKRPTIATFKNLTLCSNKTLQECLFSSPDDLKRAILRELRTRNAGIPRSYYHLIQSNDTENTTPSFEELTKLSATTKQPKSVFVKPPQRSLIIPELPNYSVDALGRYRFKPVSEGKVSTEIERVETSTRKIKRDGTFRQRVLETYGIRCVMCGYSNYVEAAHLVPKHQANDDRTENGAPLCPNHHWELDHGLITADEVRMKRDHA